MSPRRLAPVIIAIVLGATAAPAVAAPTLVRDVKTGRFTLPSLSPAGTALSEYVQPDTQIEPSIGVNPANPDNVVAAYQEGRIDSGGDATNGYATSFDGGKTWTSGELPGLTRYGNQGGMFDRGSDAVVAFGPDNTVYVNSLIFDSETGGGLRSAIAVNVSKDGGRTWSPPVIFQDDQVGGLNDKNWIVVDNSDAPGHHKGRVYVIWDRVAPVVYDYCDHDCDQVGNWLPNLQTVSGLVFPAQGIGAYPLVMPDGSLGVVLQTTTAGIPTTLDEPEPTAGNNQVFLAAPGAGSIPYPAPLVFEPPVQIGVNHSAGVPAQRASDGLPSAAVDPKTGALYAVWDDARFRTDATNDAVLSRSTDGGTTWSAPVRVNPGPKDDHVDHYNVTVSVAEDSKVHVAYRQRDESGTKPNYSPVIDTYYQESTDGAKTFSAPLKIDSVPSDARYDAKSRNGSFEGDYNQMVTSGDTTYVVRTQGGPAYAGEPPALKDNGDGTLALTEEGKTHTHQSTWVAVVRDVAGSATGTTTPAGSPVSKRCTSHRRVTIHLPRSAVRARVTVGGRVVKVRRRAGRLIAVVDVRGLARGRVTVRISGRTRSGRRVSQVRRLRTCASRAAR